MQIFVYVYQKKRKKILHVCSSDVCVCVWCLDMEFWKEKKIFFTLKFYISRIETLIFLCHTHTHTEHFFLVSTVHHHHRHHHSTRQAIHPSIHPIWAPTFYLLVREKPEKKMKKKISNQIIMVDWYSQNQVCISFFFIYQFTVVQKKRRA